MRALFQKYRFLLFFFAFLALLLISLVGCLLLLRIITKKQIQSAHERYDSYQLATELRQTSNDLTTMVRLYVVTGEKKYKDFFHEILTIRNGTTPRPENYHQIYWALVLDPNIRPRPFGKAKSLEQMMLEQHFTNKEFNLLKEAKIRSDNLAKMEEEAMNAIVGKYLDETTGKYSVEGKPNPELARKLVFGDEYMRQKALIMTPVQQFFESIEARTKKRNDALNRQVLIVIVSAIVLAALSTIVMLISLIKALKDLSQATRENELLLLNILPEPIANRLKGGEEIIADEIPQASVLFSDIVGFTQMTFKFGGTKMVKLLNQLFDEFDHLTEEFGVEKVKTIGDNYMAVAGVPTPLPDHAIRLADFALAMQGKLDEFNQKNNMQLEMRSGMTYGAVIAGVIGHKKFIYDVWGDVVNTASRMETTGKAGEIHITEKMALMLEDLFVVEPCEEMDVKGKGMMKTYFLKSRKSVVKSDKA